MGIPDSEFDLIALEEWENIPTRFKERLDNVALLIEDQSSEDIRAAENLEEENSLLGLYQGVPLTERGGEYGVGETVPDTITLYRRPIQQAALDFGSHAEAVRHVIKDTIWHEVGHYFGLSESEIHEREKKGTNLYAQTQLNKAIALSHVQWNTGHVKRFETAAEFMADLDK